MKAHTSGLKDALKTFPLQTNEKITFGTTVLTSDELINVEPVFNGNILKSMMKGLTIESTTDIPKDTVVNYQKGILVNDSYEYLNFGNYVVINSEKKEDADSYLITCYDKLVYSAVDYVDLEIEYPISIADYLEAICNYLGLTLKTKIFNNADLEIPSELYLNLGYKFRDVLDEISQATGTSICLDLNDQVELRVPTATNDTIDEDFIASVNAKFGEKYGPINSIVLSRSAESDNVYIKDDESIALNGLCELKIFDNQIMNGNDRSDYLQGIADNVFGLEYYTNDYNSTGVYYYDFLDKYSISIDSQTYNCLMLNDDISTIDDSENIFTKMPDVAETDYSKASKTDKSINRAYIIVDKVQNEIDEVVEATKDLTDYINVIQDNNSIILTNTMTSIGAINYIELTNINQPNLYPGLEYPGDTSYPSKITNYTIVFTKDNDVVEEYVLVGYNLTTSDKLIITPSLIELIKPNQDTIVQQKSILTTFDETTTITIKGITSANIKCEYIIKNDFTTQFATTGDIRAVLKISEKGIATKVSKGDVVSEINQSAEEVKINANKISLEGTITANENFKVNLDGSIEAKNGKFSGIIDGGQIKVNGDNHDDKNLPFIEIYTTKPNEFSTIDTAGVRQWAVGISAYNYNNNNYNEPVIRTETADGYAELEGTQVNAFGFNNVSLEEKKKNFENLENALSIIKKTSIYKFNYKGEKDNYKKHIGLVIGDNYSYSKDLTNNENNAVDLYSMVGVCFKAIQEQQQIIENLQKEMEEIRNEKNTI